jgi:hypothetical protein
MAKINIDGAGGGALDTGILQLANGVAMDATLRAVTDQNNTASPLKVSTTAVQVTSPLRITTSDASGFYLDAEDSATNNRFSIKRDPSAQEVTLDFASNPSGSTTLVGAIRTYQDGINLSNAMSFIENGSVGIGTNAPVGLLDLFKSAAATRLAIRGDAGQNRLISYRTGAVQRFGLYVNNTAESGSNAGSNFAIRAYNDAGTLLSTPFFINRATGNVGVNTLTGTAKLQVVGSGSTSATTSLLVQNTGTFELLKVQDDGTCSIGGNGLTTFPLQVYGNTGLQIIVGNSFFQLGAARTIRANAAGSGAMKFEVFSQVSATDNRNYAFFPNQTIQTAGSNADWSGINIETIVNTQTDSKITQLLINPTLNLQANTTSGAIQRGIYYNPTITNLYTAQHYGIQTTSGGAYINTATPNATACLQADSTTQGFLPPRMTNAERAAITTPAIGLMVYCTDVVEGLYVYKSTGWTFVI